MVRNNISAENSVQKDISARINKARNSYCSLRNIWKSNIYCLKTKLRLFNSNVISVLLYGCQSWRVSKDDMNKLDVFQTKCLRRTCNIFWPNKISNEDLYRRTNSSPISTQIQKHRLRWLGHVLRMPQDSIPKVALRWTPTGKRNRGRPKTTCRRTITTELSDMGLTMGEAQVIAQDRHRWRRDIEVGSNDSRLHVVEPPRGRSFIWQIGVNSSIQDRRQVDRGFLWSRVSCTRQR